MGRAARIANTALAALWAAGVHSLLASLMGGWLRGVCGAGLRREPVWLACSLGLVCVGWAAGDGARRLLFSSPAAAVPAAPAPPPSSALTIPTPIPSSSDSDESSDDSDAESFRARARARRTRELQLQLQLVSAPRPATPPPTATLDLVPLGYSARRASPAGEPRAPPTPAPAPAPPPAPAKTPREFWGYLIAREQPTQPTPLLARLLAAIADYVVRARAAATGGR